MKHTHGAAAVMAAMLLTAMPFLRMPVLSVAQADGEGSLSAVATAPYTALLSWTPDFDAAAYELEIFSSRNDSTESPQPSETPLYQNHSIYTSSTIVHLKDVMPDVQRDDVLWWRVRPLDLDRRPIGSFTALKPLQAGGIPPMEAAPLPRSHFNSGQGTTLLYPVYSFTPDDEASHFEVEVTDAPPESRDPVPSKHRVFSRVIENANLYDPSPRIGSYWWRVRSLDAEGNPLGPWSEAESFRTDPADGWQAGVLGDSISHGGGRLSYGPADWAYSYESYLSFPVINLSQSGDTSEMTKDRFEADVVPFHLEYLLIMTGSNSLRAGIPPEAVIADLEAIQEKCRQNGITPILLTLPPLNPASIEKAFDEPTDEHWKKNFAIVNDWIRTQISIDTAAAFAGWEEMPQDLAADGIHGDWRAKEMMARVINEAMPRLAPDLPYKQ